MPLSASVFWTRPVSTVFVFWRSNRLFCATPEDPGRTRSASSASWRAYRCVIVNSWNERELVASQTMGGRVQPASCPTRRHPARNRRNADECRGNDREDNRVMRRLIEQQRLHPPSGQPRAYGSD